MQLVSAGLVERVAKLLHLYSTQSQPLNLGVAVSGGADSVVLLHILTKLKRSVAMQLTILHVNHQLRGFESQNDELFVRELAAALNLPVYVGQCPPPPGNLEAQARRVRQEFFHQARRDYELQFVALGHTASDQAETVLFRLLRGSGLRGLAGMRPAGSNLLRPLLTTTRKEVREYAHQHGLSWREDSSNRDLRFRRNRLRLETMPELERLFNPNLEQVLSGYANVARDEEDYLSAETARSMASLSRPFAHGDGLLLDAPALLRLPAALQRRVIRSALNQVRGHLLAIDLPHVEAILAVASSKHGHDRVQAPVADILRSFDTILITRPETLKSTRNYSLEVPFGVPIKLPECLGIFSVDPVNSSGQTCATVKDKDSLFIEEATLDWEAVAEACGTSGLQVRNWRPGDQILLPGEGHPRKLKTLFQEHRILLWERRYWPVLVAGERILWVRRFAVAAEFAATVESRRLLSVRYGPPGPFSPIVSESKE